MKCILIAVFALIGEEPTELSRVDQLTQALRWTLENSSAPNTASLEFHPRDYAKVHERVLSYRSYAWTFQSDDFSRFVSDLAEKKYRKSEYVEAYSHLSLNERKKLYLISGVDSLAGAISGSQINVYPSYFLEHLPNFSSAEIVEIAEAIKNPLGTVWNGTSHTIEYSDNEFESKVQALSKLLQDDRYSQIFTQYFSDHSDFFKSTNTESPESQIEPIDLISELLLPKIQKAVSSDLYRKNMSFEISPTEMSRLIRLAFHQQWTPTAYFHLKRIPIGIFVSPSANEIVAVCPSDKMELDFDANSVTSISDQLLFRPFSYLQFQMIRIHRDELKRLGHLNFSLRCGAENYKGRILIPARSITSSSEDVEVILPPLGQDTPIQSLMTFGLTPSLSAEMRAALKAYLESKQWILRSEEKIQVTKELMKEMLVNSDAVSPMAHAIDQGRLQFGFENSVQLKFERTTSESKKNESLTLILPSEENALNQEVILNREDIISVLKNRKSQGKARWLVLNLTCRGASLLPAWSAMARDSELAESDLPIVFASKNGFQATSMVEYQSLATFFNRFVEISSTGGSLNSARDLLDKPIEVAGFKIKDGFNTVTNWDPAFADYRSGTNLLKVQLADFSGIIILEIE